jgi:hypothetical protein
MKVFKIIGIILLFIILTILSQVGGIILIIWIILFHSIKKKITNKSIKICANYFGFILFYLFFVFIIIPLLAKIQDREPLPFSKSGNLIPVSYWTAIFNRNYIKSEGKNKLEEIANTFVKNNPEIKVKYMDCNFPFRININGSSNVWILEGLIPHITHDGNKVDLALVFNDDIDKPSNLTPTAIGYGSSALPLPNETCTPCDCDKTNWQYSFMYRNLPSSKLNLNEKLTSELIDDLINYGAKNIIIEPHLIQRFKKYSKRIRNYTFSKALCTSVRHDDHIHAQLCN